LRAQGRPRAQPGSPARQPRCAAGRALPLDGRALEACAELHPRQLRPHPSVALPGSRP
jgi:hypothetical protein